MTQLLHLLACVEVAPVRVEPPPASVFVRDPERSVPVTGGGLAVDGDVIVALDAPADVVHVLDADTLEEHAPPAGLERGSWPFRVAIRDGVAWVTLRGADALLRLPIDGQGPGTVAPTCPEPRGVDVDDDGVVVACASGGIAEHDGDGRLRRTGSAMRDARDIVLDGDKLWVTTFRDARIYHVDRQSLETLQSVPTGSIDGALGRVAWRAVRHPRGGVLVLHQLHAVGDTALDWFSLHMTSPGTCDRAVDTATSWAFATGEGHVQVVPGAPVAEVSLGVDIATDDDGAAWIAAAGNGIGEPRVVAIDDEPAPGVCQSGTVGPDRNERRTVGVAFHNGRRIELHRPFAVTRDDDAPRSSVDVEPVALFHDEVAPASIACASCHPEGQDDGSQWALTLDEPVARRTQQVAGRLDLRAPYHWTGDLDFTSLLLLVSATFDGATPTADQADALLGWLSRLEPVRVTPVGDVGVGEQVFATSGCGDCHQGDALTDNSLRFQGAARVKVPSLLGVGYRGPWKHDGCALTLADRFQTCSDPLHPEMSHEAAEALAAWLETL